MGDGLVGLLSKVAAQDRAQRHGRFIQKGLGGCIILDMGMLYFLFTTS